MKYQPTHTVKGFSAVELLITLFIAAAFLLAGHMLYATIIQDSGSTRQRAIANNIAYDYLRRYAGSAPATCAASTPLNNSVVSPAPNNLSNVTVTITYSCPDSTLSSLTRVEARVKYGADAQEVIHAIYTTP